MQSSALLGSSHALASPFGSTRRPAERVVLASASLPVNRQDKATTHRRAIVGGLALLLGLPQRPAQAGFGWDGTSAAQGSCAVGEDGADCRRQQLLKDKVGSTVYPSKQDGRPQALTQGIPIAEMKDAYTKDTVALSDVVDKYFSLDSFDPARANIVKTLKTDGAAWASKYARGGSARKLSARKFYIVVDALQGHLTSNGFAPLAPAKTKTLQKNLEETRDLLAKGA